MKKGKNGSIGLKLSIIVAAVLMLILGIKTGYDAVNLYSMEMKFNEKIELEKTRKLTRETEAIFTSMYQSMNDVRTLAEEYLSLPVQDRKRDLVIKCLTEITRKNTEIDGLGVAFEKDKFDGRDDIDGRFTVYAELYNGEIELAKPDPVGKDWYDRPMQEKKMLVLPLYEDEGELLATLALPIMHEGEAVGVVNADINLKNFQHRIEVVEGNSADSAKLIITNNGIIVANSIDAGRNMQALSGVQEEIRQILNSEEVIAEKVSAATGIYSKIIAVPIRIPGVADRWMYQSVNTMSSFTRNAKSSLWMAIGVNLGVTMLMIVLIYLLIKK